MERSLARRYLAAVACLFAMSGASAANAPVRLPQGGVGGQSAIDLLGPQLSSVAALNRRTPEALQQLLLADPSMRLDHQGRLFVMDHLDAPLPRPARAAGARVDTQPLVPLDQTFMLHSRKNAKRTIYLDFNGAVLSGTAWNTNGTINAQPFDADGDVQNFSATELQTIQYIWQRVAEDFAPFDVDVTTEEPVAARINRSSPTDEIFGTTVLITNHEGVYDCSCGGIAYVGVFDSIGPYYKPALVFWDMLGHGDEKYVAEAISHEAGHNLGLSHDGYPGGGYYSGHGSGATGWAPIMGVGYYQPVVQWSRGEYDGATNTEDDFAVIQSYGALLRADDHANQIDGATPMTSVPSGRSLRLSANGVIEDRFDKDFFSFTAGAGAAKITVAPDSRSPNLDVYVKIYSATGSQIAVANPVDTLGASVTFNLPRAGTYYVMVDGVGVYSPKDAGYSGYGSVGKYTISGTVPAP